MFDDVHLMRKTLALVFCIKILYTKTCYVYIHTPIKVIKFKAIFILNTQCCNIIILVPIHIAARKYKKSQAVFFLFKHVITIENIIAYLVKKVLFQQNSMQLKLSAKSLFQNKNLAIIV